MMQRHFLIQMIVTTGGGKLPATGPRGISDMTDLGPLSEGPSYSRKGWLQRHHDQTARI